VLGGAGDQGVDVIVNRHGERVAVQCKNHKRPVGNRPVQEVYAGAQHHRCAEARVVAPAGYTRGAIALARSTGVSLYDADTVRQWVRKVDKIEKERASESEISDQTTPINREIAEARKRGLSGIHIPTTHPRVSVLQHVSRSAFQNLSIRHSGVYLHRRKYCPGSAAE
jgi:Restriction endonuclease